MKLISIIIPVYNTEKYLDLCLKSVVSQTHQNLEIILVDDGSTDGSGGKCDKWASQDSRIKVYHKTNGGLMSAWKYGVTYAQGEYIGFVDSDDWIDVDMYAKLLSKALELNVDLVMSGIVYEKEGESRKEIFLLKGGKYERAEIEEEIFPIYFRDKYYYHRVISATRVTKLFKKGLLLEVLDYCDEKISIGEDLVTTFAVMSKVQSIAVVTDFYAYHYRINNTSMIQTYSDSKYEKLVDLKYAMDRVAKELYNYDFNEQLNGDYISLVLAQIECEILFSGKNFANLKKSLRYRVSNELFLKSLSGIDREKLTPKQKLYLFLIKNKLLGCLIGIRRLKGIKK